MDDSTFLELPLDRDLYKPKTFRPPPKHPLRVLITDAGGKIAYNIIYKICTGEVFGPDQEIILHMINSRGSIHHKAIVLELAGCGLSVCKDFVVSCNPAVAYRKVDVVIVIATYEELPGRMITSTLIYHMIKARQVAKHIQDHANKGAKIIFTGPSTKACAVLIGTFFKFSTKIPIQNVTCMTWLDAVISKAVLAAKLKTTTNRIKNVIVWACTVGDVRNATVRMYPPNDRGDWEMKDIPVAEALQDDAWLYTTFVLSTYRRVMRPDLVKFGKAVALSTVEHLKGLFKDTESTDEIMSMGAVTPPSKPYGMPPGYGFSYPVRIHKGNLEIIEDLQFDVPTQTNMLRVVFNLTHGLLLNSIMKVVSFMLDYEAAKKKMIKFSSKYFMDEVIEARHWTTKYFITPNPAEVVPKPVKEKTRFSRKSIIWDDELSLSRKKTSSVKSSIRFSAEAVKNDRKESRMNYNKESFYSYKTDDMIPALTKATSGSSRYNKKI